MTTGSRSYCVAQGVLFQELDGESVLLHLGTEQYYALDRTGTRIWRLMAENLSVDAAVTAMLAEYAAEESALRRDVEDLVRKLVAKGLLLVAARAADGVDA